MSKGSDMMICDNASQIGEKGLTMSYSRYSLGYSLCSVDKLSSELPFSDCHTGVSENRLII
jgi:hypothetical protein